MFSLLKFIAKGFIMIKKIFKTLSTIAALVGLGFIAKKFIAKKSTEQSEEV
jgi:hypothetical protein